MSDDVLADTIRMQQLTEQLLLLLARVAADRLRDRRTSISRTSWAGRSQRHQAAEGVCVAATSLEPVQLVGEPLLLEHAARDRRRRR